MSELFLNPAKTCAVTGHRVVEKNFNRKELKDVFIKLIDNGFDTFLIGMALGFDTLCFNLLYELKSEYEIKLVACIPCEKQDLKYNYIQKQEYEEMLKKTDEKVYICKEYNATCMKKRNEYMVNNSSVIIAYLRRNYGGTFYTVNYAEKNQKVIISV